MNSPIHGSFRSPHRAGPASGTGTHRLRIKIAFGIAAGALIGTLLHLSGKAAPETEAVTPPSTAQALEQRSKPMPPLVLTGVVHDAALQRSYAVISVAGAAAREFRVGDALAEDVQLVEIADDAVTVVGNGRAVRIALTYIAPPVQADPRITTRGANDWRNASSARSKNEPASAPPTVVAPPRGFTSPSSTSTDRAVWRARQNSYADVDN
ncbi:type II secretion system protein N [Niveibacterium sp.]|uniref:type II secretion system protein N n=1 Tax=Niveibacterium sp. TaxID=2017444 RepID=UPI0035B115A5